MNIFGRSKPIRAMPLSTAPKLPTNFAEKLLELETQLAYNLSVNLISSLMQLYSSAIEYYESIQDKKYLHYKDRLSSLLSKKEVLEVLSPSSKSEKKIEPVRPKLSETHTFEELKTKIVNKRPVSGNLSATQPVQKKDVDSAIKEHLHESSNASSMVKASIRSQEGDNLQQRLQARKRASSLKPQKPVEKQEKADKEDQKTSKIELYQKAIEDIMEKYAEDKVLRIQAIEKKYTAGPGTQEERERLKKKEIEEAQLEIIRERKEKIIQLRTRFEPKEC